MCHFKLQSKHTFCHLDLLFLFLWRFERQKSRLLHVDLLLDEGPVLDEQTRFVHGRVADLAPLAQSHPVLINVLECLWRYIWKPVMEKLRVTWFRFN